MFRIKLTTAIAVLLAMVLLLATILYWGAQREEYYFERSYLAHDASQAYLQLSHDTYRHFKELVDIVVLDDDASVEQAKLTYQMLQQSLKRLRFVAAAEIAHVNERELVSENEELEQIVAIEKLLSEGIWAFERIKLLQRRGAEAPAQKVLSEVLEQTIDLEFKPLIDAAISDELAEAAEARHQARQLISNLKWIAAVAAIIAFCLALAMAVWLWRSLSTPLNKLVKGVRQVARGDLMHRIEMSGRNEFTYLARKFNDMTQQLNQQRKRLLAAQAELEDKVEARTQELEQANEKLQHIDEGRRHFFADISHELRTPLTAIRGEAEVTVRGKDKNADEYREALVRIVKLSDQLGKLVEELLFMARSESTGIHFELKPLVLNEVISELCEDARALTLQKQLQFHLDIPEHNVSVYGDRLRLRQVLLILIDNACRYSDTESELTITLRSDQGNATLAVRDQGMGVSDAELGKVFERFYRGKQARKRVPSGSGLGLLLAKSIVEAHHGRIELASELGQGTCVTITLPVIF